MSWNPEQPFKNPPKGMFIATLLINHPGAVVAAAAEASAVPPDEVTIASKGLLPDFTRWVVDRYLEGGDWDACEDVVLRGVTWAYAVGRNIDPDYTPSLTMSCRPRSNSLDAYERLVTDSLVGATNYGVITAAADRGHDFIDPANVCPWISQLSPLVGFAMLNNGALLQARKEYEGQQAERDAEIAQLENIFSAA